MCPEVLYTYKILGANIKLKDWSHRINKIEFPSSDLIAFLKMTEFYFHLKLYLHPKPVNRGFLEDFGLITLREAIPDTAFPSMIYSSLRYRCLIQEAGISEEQVLIQ